MMKGTNHTAGRISRATLCSIGRSSSSGKGSMWVAGRCRVRYMVSGLRCKVV
ncbi:MAG: hypothetical protein IKJ52_10720 [Muribaculaceae bacterium]|nr:hypothetical protein [Muribaculaceae bacterium]